MSGVTRPVVARPDSVTHWTCPAAPGDTTHHLVGGVCRYCDTSERVLRAEQAGGRSDYDLGWEAGYRGTTPPENPSAEWGQGYSAGFGSLLASEKRWEQES